MKKFRTKKNNREKRDLLILIIAALVLILLHYYNIKISKKVVDISSTKVEEITNLYIKKDIVPQELDMNKLILVTKNKNDEILYVDIDNKYANDLMINVVNKIQNNINKLDIKGDDFLRKFKNVYYLEIPLLFISDGSLYTNLGPKIPVKLSFYEHAFGNIDVELNSYGINNALLKVYLSIILEQKLYIPYKEKKNEKEFKLLIGTKVINGSVPNIFGSGISKQSSLIEI